MAPNKQHHHKSKPKKHLPLSKKHGKQESISEFRGQLDVLGLKIIQVTSDGNCFFRALADQLEGSEEEHEKYRNMVVDYIMKNREMFEPFIEDNVPFEQYCQSMEKDGTWAGHMELQAASLATRNNICIHLHMSPRWYIQNFGTHGSMIHLSYHDGEHYNSVRMEEDPCDGPAKPVSIKGDVNLTASSQAAKSPSAHSNGETFEYSGTMKMVMACSNCNSAEKVEQVLRLVDGDADAAIEFLIVERYSGEAVEQNCVPFEDDIDYKGFDEDKYSNKLVNKRAPANCVDKPVEAETVVGCKSSSIVDKKIPRNKVCHCGSKKKNKACCGAATGRASSKLKLEYEENSASSSRGKQGKKKTQANKAPYRQDRAMPDMGALCI